MVASVAAKIQALEFLTVLVEEHEVWVVVRDKVDLQSLVRVSMARILDELPYLRQLVQASPRAALYLRRPRANHADALVVLAVIASVGLIQAFREEVEDVVALPASDIRSEHTA